MIENFEVIHSLQIGAREAVVGVSPDQEFMCCFCTQDDIAEYYSEAMSSTDYLEIMELYADRLKGQIAAAQAQRRTLHIPLDMLGREHCFPLLDVDDITGKVVAVKPASLRYEYQRADCQLILVTGAAGHGAILGALLSTASMYSQAAGLVGGSAVIFWERSGQSVCRSGQKIICGPLSGSKHWRKSV